MDRLRHNSFLPENFVFSSLHHTNPFLQLCKFSGILFMAVCTVLFYNSLFVAYGNPGFFTWVYFDAFSEGLIELVIFILVIPFIALALVSEGLDLIKTIKASKVVQHEVPKEGPLP